MINLVFKKINDEYVSELDTNRLAQEIICNKEFVEFIAEHTATYKEIEKLTEKVNENIHILQDNITSIELQIKYLENKIDIQFVIMECSLGILFGAICLIEFIKYLL